MKSSGFEPKSSNASSYTDVSNLKDTARSGCIPPLRVRVYALIQYLRGAQHRLGHCLWFLLARSLVPLLLLLLICQRCQDAGCFTNFYISQRHRQLANMVLEESSIKGLILMSFDDELYDLVREIYEIFLRSRLGGYQGIQFRGRRAYHVYEMLNAGKTRSTKIYLQGQQRQVSQQRCSNQHSALSPCPAWLVLFDQVQHPRRTPNPRQQLFVRRSRPPSLLISP